MDRNILIGFLDRNRLQLYNETLAAPISLDFSPGTVANLEIGDEVSLSAQINNWLTRYKLTPANLILVLADAVYFTQELIGESPEKMEDEGELFIETVPFEEILSKRYVLNKRTIMVAANKEFVEIFKSVLDQTDIALVSVIPEVILGPYGANHWLDAAMGKYIKAHEEALLGESLVEFEKTKAAVKNAPKKVAGVNRVWILVGVFAFLIGVLIILILPR